MGLILRFRLNPTPWGHHTDHGLWWLQGSVAEAAARRAHAPALFLLEDQRGFVDRETGAISLKTILLPIDGTVPHRDA
jgi:nucleotide-binding universal stress UspA family protein